MSERETAKYLGINIRSFDIRSARNARCRHEDVCALPRLYDVAHYLLHVGSIGYIGRHPHDVKLFRLPKFPFRRLQRGAVAIDQRYAGSLPCKTVANGAT